jgi:hypothetical protein
VLGGHQEAPRLEVPTAEALDVVYEPPEGYLFALAGEFVPKAETEWQHRRDGWNSEALKRTADKDSVDSSWTVFPGKHII